MSLCSDTVVIHFGCSLFSVHRCRQSLTKKNKPLLKLLARCERHHRGCCALWCVHSYLYASVLAPLLPSTQSAAAQEKLSTEVDALKQQMASITCEKEEEKERAAKSVEDKVRTYMWWGDHYY